MTETTPAEAAPTERIDAAVEEAAPVAAVILAAGAGLRLGRPSKPLARVAGLTLLERAVAAARAAGIERVIVVVGHAKEDVAQFVGARKLDVELVENHDFSVGDGSSALAGGQVAGGRFLLMMCDHVVEPDALARVIASAAPFAVAVDMRPAYCDTAEATKVRLRNGAIVAVGRDLDDWDGVDAGIFVCDRSVLETVDNALFDGARTWNAVKRRWIAEGRRLEAVDIGDTFWIDVDTPDDVRRAERLLVARAAAKPLDGLVSRRLNRPLSRRISQRLLRWGISPTTITVVAFALTLAAAALVALGAVSPAAIVAGGVLVQASSVVDGCDGEVARATLRTSAFGALLDMLLDRLADAALVTALAVAAGLEAKTLAVLACALFFAMLVPYLQAAFEATARAPLPPARATFGRDARMLVIAVGAVAGAPFAALIAATAVSAGESAARSVRALRAAPRRG